MSIKDVITRQVTFQQNMKSNQDTMKLAFIEELGEYVASTGFADWKKVQRDEANMDIELIDMAVFAINIAYYSGSLDREPLSYMQLPANDLQLVEDLTEKFVKGQWLDIVYYIFHHKPILLQVITAKQALNQLRQDYGYKSGEYIKDWNGKEDNTYLAAFYGQEHDEIYVGMEKIYTEKIIGSRLVDA